MSAPLPDAPLFCPVCERPIDFIWLWQDPASTRVRMFCEVCSHSPEYRPLPKAERTILSLESFQRFAARRLLAHVVGNERAKRTGPANSHGDAAV